MMGRLARAALFMFVFIAFVLALIALVIAANARSEVRALRAALEELKRTGAVRPGPQRTPAPAPVPMQVDTEPAPSPAVAPEVQPVAAAIATPPPIPIYEPPVAAAYAAVPPPPPPPRATPPPSPARPASAGIDWESLVGIKLFGWIAGIALVLAAVFLFKYSVDHGWLRPAIRAGFGFAFGIGLLVICELRVARNYKLTANAMLGAGIAILYATLFALYGRWHLWPATAAFFGMLLVTAAAVYLSTRRDSIFIALLGLLGGFATPALLSSGENRPIALFSYLLLLNGGISWIAFRKRWPLLTALSVILTVIYQWAWVQKFLDSGQLPLAAAIFIVFALMAAIVMWQQGESDSRQRLFRMVGAAGAVLPLLFAFFTAIVPEYGARFHVLFGFLFLLAAGLSAIAMWRGPRWMHALGALATLLTFFIWLTVSYTSQSWPWSLVWLAAFILLFLLVGLRIESIGLYAGPALFFVFIGLAAREPYRFTLPGAMLALLVVLAVFAWRLQKWGVVPIALGLSSVATLVLVHSGGVRWSVFVSIQSTLFVALFAVAWIARQHWLTLAVFPFAIATVIVAGGKFGDAEALAMGAILYALFVIYPASLRRRLADNVLPHLATVTASAGFFLLAYMLRKPLGFAGWIGLVPVVEAVLLFVLLVLLLRLPANELRYGILANAILGLLTFAVGVQLEGGWLAVGWAILAVAVAWLFTRLQRSLLLYWTTGLAVLVLLRLASDPHFPGYVPTYLFCAAATFVITWLVVPKLRPVPAAIATIELFMLLNVAIDKYYELRPASSLAEDLTYTVGWALFAIAMLVAGIILESRAARIAALGLLVVTVLKCFLHDLGELGGLYRVASLFGLAVSLVLVGLVLQKFVIMKRVKPASETSPSPTGTT
jgi:hypothetical protein